MTIRVAINGFGRIGRNILRACYESNRNQQIQIVAINDIADIKTNAHLAKYDSTHGRFNGEITLSDHHMHVNGDDIQLIQERDATKLPWADLNIDVVLACSGHFTTKEKAMQHVKSGAKKVLISAPGKEVDATVVYGVNHQILKAEHTVVSNASCTTNCLAPMAKVLNDTIGIEHGLMNTIHAYTKDQMILDGHHSDLRRARAAAHSIIPTKTGAAAAVGLVLPELSGKLDGFAMRVPTMNVSVVDLTFKAKHNTTIDEINSIMRDAAEGNMRDILAYNDEPLVSCDFNHNPASSIFDSTQTKILDGNFVKVCSWYDNEWGFSNRMLDTTATLMQAK